MNSIIIPQLSKLTDVLKGQDDFMYLKNVRLCLSINTLPPSKFSKLQDKRKQVKVKVLSDRGSQGFLAGLRLLLPSFYPTRKSPFPHPLLFCFLLFVETFSFLKVSLALESIEASELCFSPELSLFRPKKN